MANLTGSEILQVIPVSAAGVPGPIPMQVTTFQISNLSGNGNTSTFITPISTVGAQVITATAIDGGTSNRTGLTAATTDTTDTAVNIIASLGSSAVIGQAFFYTYMNSSAFNATIAGGVGVTVSGITVVPPNSYAKYLLTYTAANTLTMVGVGSGPIQVATVGGSFLSTIATATAFTLTGIQIGNASDVTVSLTGALAAGAAITLPTVSTLVAAGTNIQGSSSYNLRIINNSAGAFAWTVTTNTGWTLVGTMTIAQATFRDFVVTYNANLTTATITSTGVGTT